MMKKKRTKGKLLAALLAMTAMFAVGAFASPVHAEGAYQIDGEYTLVQGVTENDVALPSADKVKDTEFRLYKVGHFGRVTAGESAGEATLEFDDALAELRSTVDLNSPDLRRSADQVAEMSETDKAAWTKEWLEAALSIENFIKSHPDAISVLKEGTVGADGKFSFSGLDNGLYLVSGDSVEIEDYTDKTGKVRDVFFAPQPMLVQILNGSQDIGIKPVIEDVTQYVVTKEWIGDENMLSLVRPEGITISIFYDGTKVEDVQLPINNNWYYAWKGTKERNDPFKWSVSENLTDEDKLNYKSECIPDPSGAQMTFKIKNTYSRQDLEIKKITPQYVKHNEKVSTSVVFEITGVDANGEQVYHTKAGLQVTGPSAEGDILNVSNIPSNVKTLTVKELYSGGNYTPQPESQTVEAEVDPETGKSVFKVTFRNKYDDTTHFGSGIVNKFQLDGDNYRITERQGSGKQTPR